MQYKLSVYKIVKPITYSICFLLILNFCLSINFKYVFDFKDQADAQECFDKVESLNAKNVGISPQLWGAFANYYYLKEPRKYNFKSDIIYTLWPEGVCTTQNKLAEFDYLILFPPYSLSYYKNSHVKIEAVHLAGATKVLILKIN